MKQRGRPRLDGLNAILPGPKFIRECIRQLLKRNPIIKAYINQKRSAEFRGIPWLFTLSSWWEVWRDSGHWHERGRGNGYCMARWADEGPYSAENVYITTNAENVKHGYLITPASVRAEKARATREAKKFAEAA